MSTYHSCLCLLIMRIILLLSRASHLQLSRMPFINVSSTNMNNAITGIYIVLIDQLLCTLQLVCAYLIIYGLFLKNVHKDLDQHHRQ